MLLLLFMYLQLLIIHIFVRKAQVANLRKDLESERQDYRNAKEKLTLAEHNVNMLNEQVSLILTTISHVILKN